MRLQAFILLVLCMLSQLHSFGQVQLEEDFSIQLVTDEISKPNGLIFSEDGKMLVWEKIGLVWLVEDGQLREEPVLDLTEEVMSNGDLGLLSIVLDPNFRENGLLYAYYIVDYHHLINYGTSLYDANKSQDNRATIGRVSSFRLENYLADPASRKVIIGKSPSEGIPVMHNSHVGGTLLFGDDGSLILSVGDGETWEGNYVGGGPPYYNSKVVQGLQDGIIREEEEVGVMRCQMINSYSGKVLRFHPETGLGYASNPFYDEASPDSPASKVWALGFRNPFRMSIRQGSGSSNPEDGLPGTLYVGEVGAASWEELNVITKKGQNYGWPIIEGNGRSELYDFLQTNKDVVNECDGEAVLFRDLVKLPNANGVEFRNPCDTSQFLAEDKTFICELPALNLAHITVGLGVFTHTFDEDGSLLNIRIEDERSEIDGDVGLIRSNAAIAGPVYGGDKFPQEYKGDLFITDFSNGWISRVELDLNEKVERISSFYKDTFRIKHIAEGPVDGCLYIAENNGAIRKICYNVNVPPLVKVNVSSSYGPSPLTVDFDASETIDPEGGSLKYTWDFGNGESSSEVNPRITYASGDIKNFPVVLKVTDTEGAESTEQLFISVNNSPPVAEIQGIDNGQLYSIVGINEYGAQAIRYDAESPSSDLSQKWSVFLHHNTHFHKEQEYFDEEVKIEVPPVGCTNELFYYRIRLDVEDPQGLIGSDEKYIYPACDDDFVDFLYFNAFAQGDDVAIEWETADESALEGIRIQKAGSDLEFSDLELVEPRGIASRYSTFDKEPFSGVNYYRLKLLGESGLEAFSEKVKILFHDEGGVLIYPNPFEADFNVYFTDLEGEALITIFDMNGRLIEEFSVNGFGAKTAKITPQRALEAGVYSILIEYGGQLIRKNVIVKR